MAFNIEQTQEVTFNCIDGMMTYIEQEKQNTSRIAIGGLLREGAIGNLEKPHPKNDKIKHF